MAIPLLAKALSVGAEYLGKKGLEIAQATQTSRRILSMYKRGRGPFGIPEGPSLILCPAKIDSREQSERDHAGATELTRMFQQLGYLEITEWERVDISTPIPATDRTKNLLILCGANPMARELLASDFLRTIQLRDAHDPEERRIRWNCEDYYWSAGRDYAILAVRPNPFNSNRRIVLMCGLRSPGTAGACELFAKPEHAQLRKEIEQQFTNKNGVLEVVLEIKHAADDKLTVEEIRVADPKRRLVGMTGEHELPIRVDGRALEKIYDSLQLHPRSVILRDYVYKIIYTRDYAMHFVTEGTWAAGDDEVVNWGRAIACDKALYDIASLNFTIQQIHPEPKQARHDLAKVLVSNRKDEKKFIAFPLPPIARNEQGRRYRTTATWPDAGYKLRDENVTTRDVITIPLNATAHVNRCTIEFVFELGGTFSVEPKFHTESSIGMNTYSHGKSCTFEATDVRPGTGFPFAITRLTK